MQINARYTSLLMSFWLFIYKKSPLWIEGIKYVRRRQANKVEIFQILYEFLRKILPNLICFDEWRHAQIRKSFFPLCDSVKLKNKWIINGKMINLICYWLTEINFRNLMNGWRLFWKKFCVFFYYYYFNIRKKKNIIHFEELTQILIIAYGNKYFDLNFTQHRVQIS